jgi:hypothetical protein
MRFLPLLEATLVATLTVSAQIPSYAPTDGLVAFYPFNGNANDESGNGHDGIITGATFAEDRNGNADASIEFNGYPVPGTNRTQVGLDNHVYVPDLVDPQGGLNRGTETDGQLCSASARGPADSQRTAKKKA